MSPEKLSDQNQNSQNSSATGNNASQASPLDLSTLSWPDIFSQHESNLRNHVDLCGMIKDHVVPESDTFHAMMGMVVRTQELIKEVEKIRTQFTPHGTASRILSGKGINKVDELRAASRAKEQEANGSDDKPGFTSGVNGHKAAAEHTPQFVFDGRPSSISIPQRPKDTKKRSRADDTSNAEPAQSGTDYRSKKKAKNSNAADTKPDNNVPSELPKTQVEDISDEVERRLKLKEEKRRKRKEPPQKKRKRDSSTSRAGPSDTVNSTLSKRRRLKAIDSVKSESDNPDINSNKGKRGAAAEEDAVDQPENGTNRRKKVKKAKKDKGQPSSGD